MAEDHFDWGALVSHMRRSAPLAHLESGVKKIQLAAKACTNFLRQIWGHFVIGTESKGVRLRRPPENHQMRLSKEERALLSERIFRRLAGVDPIWIGALEDGEASYKKLSQTHEELTFLLSNLVSEGKEIAISTRRPVWRKVIERLLAEAQALLLR